LALQAKLDSSGCKRNVTPPVNNRKDPAEKRYIKTPDGRSTVIAVSRNTSVPGVSWFAEQTTWWCT